MVHQCVDSPQQDFRRRVTGSVTGMRRQRGVALLATLGLGLLLGAALLLNRFNHVVAGGNSREAATARSLAEAKGALIAWAVTVPSVGGRSTTPGLLPFPDRNRDGNYDGKGDCVTFGLNDSHLLGRLPWAGDVSPCPRIGLHVDIRDGSGERLWYAVSRNLVTNGGAGSINPDMGETGKMIHPWIVVRDSYGNVVTGPGGTQPLPVAAVIIAPGAALGHQDRSAAAASPDNYLDRITIGGTTFDNADADGCPDAVTSPCASSSPGEEFIRHGQAGARASFNDRLIYITVNELMGAVEKRVLGEIAVAMNNYRDGNGGYPWLAGFRSDTFAPSFKSTLTRSGQVPVHLPDEIFSTSFGGFWDFIDATPTTTTSHSGDAKLVPPLADVESGSIYVSRRDGRCMWRDWTRVDCVGSRVVPAYLRADLGSTVTRTVAYSFSYSDKSPTLTPPASGDVRRRSLSIRAARLPRVLPSPGSPPLLPEAPWSIRISDDDGTGFGQRTMTIDSDTGGAIRVSGVRYDLSIVYDDKDDARDELPEWFAENNWQHFIYAAFSADAAPGGNSDGDGDCSTPVNTCLRLKVAGKTVRFDVEALLISSGGRWMNQDRDVGDCDGDGIRDGFLCAYLEGDNSDKSTAMLADTYARDQLSAVFNDQLRIVAPLPP